jgi:ribosome-binding factor A
MIRRNNPYKRKDRVASELKKAISHIIEFEMGDDRLREVTLTDVVVSDDLRHAKVFVGASLITEDNKKVLTLLNNAKGFIRKSLSERIRIRYMPDLHFAYDNSMEYGFKIDKILKEVKDDE